MYWADCTLLDALLYNVDGLLELLSIPALPDIITDPFTMELIISR